MDNYPGPEVQALLDGGALRDGLGCDGEGGVGLNLLWYLLKAGAVVPGGRGGGGSSRGGTHSGTALSGSRGSHGSDGSHSCWSSSSGSRSRS